MQEIASLSQGNRLNVKTIYKTLEIMPESKKKSLTEALMFVFGECIQNSFKNGYARDYLEILLTYMNAKSTHYFYGQYQTTKFYLKVERKGHKSPSTSNLSYGVKAKSSDESDLASGTDEMHETDGTDESQVTSPIKTSKQRHYVQDVRIPNYVVRERSATGVFIGTAFKIVIEVKCKFTYSEIGEGISQILSYGLAQRCHQKSEKKTLLVLITPKYWLYGILPPFGEKISSPFMLTIVDVFDYDYDENVLVKENYIYMLKLLSKFFS